MEKAKDAIGLLLTDDLIFSSRVAGTARDLGLVVKSVKSAQNLVALAQEQSPTCVIVDLGNPGLRIEELIKDLEQLISPMPRVVAYGSHVDTATLRAAREAGCDPVLPRSKFVEDLSRLLPEWLSTPTEQRPNQSPARPRLPSQDH